MKILSVIVGLILGLLASSLVGYLLYTYCVAPLFVLPTPDSYWQFLGVWTFIYLLATLCKVRFKQ